MARVLFVQPWNYHDEDIRNHNLEVEWRNGPYSLLVLATQLKRFFHEPCIADLARELVRNNGNVQKTLQWFSDLIIEFKPDIIAFTFFSVHYLEIKRAIQVARVTCKNNGLKSILIGGGIHATLEPQKSLLDLDLDYVCIGEGDLSLVQLANGDSPGSIQGVYGKDGHEISRGVEVRPLDLLPYPDWSLCDYQFYALPSYGKVKFKKSRTLDIMMGRGCINKCNFCAYSTVSSPRYYSAGYLIHQIELMIENYSIDSVYFLDSSLGNNQKLLLNFCELMKKKNLNSDFEWYANIRSDQVNKDLLMTLWEAGCRFLFYGFESGSQRILNAMNKGITVEQNLRAAEIHNQLGFPYHASIIIGYPGETESDIRQTIQFLQTARPPIVGINPYVPLPGSPDYRRLIREGHISLDDPNIWRDVGETNYSRLYADMRPEVLQKLIEEINNLIYGELCTNTMVQWGFNPYKPT